MTPEPPSPDPGPNPRLARVALLAFAAISVLGIWLRPLIPIDETRYVDIAWEMRLEHSWLLPIKNYGLYTDKPPLLFWLINLGWTMTGGVSGFVARLIGPIFGLIAIWGTGRLARRLWDERTADIATVVLTGMTVYSAYAGLTMFDTMLTCATLLGIGALWQAMQTPKLHLRAWACYGLAIAFGVYAKGPVIALHLLPVLLSFPLWTDPARRPSLRTVLAGAGIALGLALLLVAIWVVPAAIAGGAEYRYMILWKQTAGRTVESFAHARPVWWFIVLLPVLLFPWIWSRSLWHGLCSLSARDRALRLVVIWGVAGFVLFSLISGKQVHYLMPEMAAAALIFARALASNAMVWRNWIPAALTIVLAVVLVALSLGTGGGKTAQLFQPWPVVALISAGLVLVAIAGWRMRPLSGLMLIGLAVVVAFDLIVGITGFHDDLDSGVIARRISPYQDGGIAVVADQYHEEFDFEGRLIPAIQMPTANEADSWLDAHPGGVLLSECRNAPLPPDQAEKHLFNGTVWCLWWGTATGNRPG